MSSPLCIDLGTMGYPACWDLQHRVHQARQKGSLEDCLLLVEHEPVFTLGKRGDQGSLLVSRADLHDRGILCIQVERGGDVTFHGPGQLVAYPIFGLSKGGVGVQTFVNFLEEAMISVLGIYGLIGEKNPQNRGVWVDGAKVGFVGIAVKQSISLHGLALNVQPDLAFFRMIHPCGLKGVRVTSMAELLGHSIPLQEVREALIGAVEQRFHVQLQRQSLQKFMERMSRNA